MALRKTSKESVPTFRVAELKRLPSPVLYMDTNTLTKYLGITRTSLWRKQDVGTFPRPFKVVGLRNYWRRKDVIAWLRTSKHGFCKLSPQALADMQGAE
jgi:Prophage CP4-57 regulatory protein (AlpA).